jgi:low temperature requirement protein LtrA
MDNQSEAAMGDEVSPLELFFDLLFVFAIVQLSHHLLEHLTWRGAAETGVLLIAVFGVWSLTSFGASMPGVRRSTWIRILFLAIGLSLFFNAGITRAFEDEPWLFVAPFLACHLGIIAFYRISAKTPLLRSHAASMVIWGAVATALWVVGALMGPEVRLWCWALAASVHLVGAWSAYWLPGRTFRTVEVSFAPAHMIERSRLFLLIVLGETILATGGAVATAEINVATIATGVLALLGTVALWALYFGGSERLVMEHSSTTGDPLRAARLAVNGQVVTAAGLIVLAVGNEIAIDHPLAPGTPTLSLLLFGGPLLYIGVQSWYLRSLTGQFPRERLVAAIVLAVAGVATWTLPPLVTIATSSVLLSLLAVQVTIAVRRVAAGRDRDRTSES